jgi:aromatic-L-amino-acid/L-tryptophan decarboxylase
MNSDEFRRFGHRLIDWIADYRATIAERPVMSQAEPGSVRASLPEAPPEQAESFDVVLRDLERVIMPGLSHWQHPSFFGYFPANSDLSSVLGEYISTGLGVLGLSWQSSPALTELEEVVVGWVRQMIGLSPAWQGVIQDTASTSTLVALVCARERTNVTESAPLVVYASAESHSSVAKAALIAGLGRHGVRQIPTDVEHAMRPDALAAAVKADVDRGLVPCAIVATTGTTASTAVDPLEPIARVAREHEAWLHVDAAMAGSAMILPECRWMWQGIEEADSVVLNPHKWLGAAFDCSLYFMRDAEHLIRVLSTSPSYLRTGSDGQVSNLRDWGIPLGRRFRALKLWCLIREQGIEGLQRRLRRDIENARWLEAQVRAASHWRVVAPVSLQTVCVRHEPPGLDGEALDDYTLAWIDRVNRSGAAYLTPAMLDGHWVARVSVGGIGTERPHVEGLWSLLRREVKADGARPSRKTLRSKAECS